jgi:L-alanine-DL-glutamate epimerase-like enolase superfamily enzyme
MTTHQAGAAQMLTAGLGQRVPVERVEVAAYTIPTDYPESDGTLCWDHTTLVLVQVYAGGRCGTGYTYADRGTAEVVKSLLAQVIQGQDAMAVTDSWNKMVAAVRNLGRPGIASTAISAVDTALWDLKGHLLNLPLVTLLGQVRASVPAYGSGGFTSYTMTQLQEQLSGWAEQGLSSVKIKVGRQPEEDVIRVRVARDAIGSDRQLFVDANGAYSRKQALAFAEAFDEFGVAWFEEPVSSDDLAGLRLLRDRGPGGMDIAAGEYGYDLVYFDRMLAAEAVDVLQADVSRCGGITGFLRAAALCEAKSLPMSSHCAPALHVHLGCAVTPLRHIEYFHDHVRIEQMLFDGPMPPMYGAMLPDLARPGLGLLFKTADARRYAV